MTDRHKYPHTYAAKALDAVCEAVEEWELDDEQIESVCRNLRDELKARADARDEEAWEDYTSRTPDTSAYRRDMIAAGRGHLLGD